ncbi:hypothetical protein BU24DRAFT_489357 [Aaosphaeria arxii CBS 175.79]|uniref:Extracellular serine-rich protein n=1 Tax=Aaosphaeria arxii CBS 175.79 TaxID=1450172 RepID=A0A6A5Y2D1_9PLEO|nr:uncharacterized protein BU24DRAFT_489357 [Aaosphaeria arxii CBS 175.79]KAF2019383.1 hypothetical protein BU24DRAFT_489357 [Aaosphaeria arxii CBS 175.79]
MVTTKMWTTRTRALNIHFPSVIPALLLWLTTLPYSDAQNVPPSSPASTPFPPAVSVFPSRSVGQVSVTTTPAASSHVPPAANSSRPAKTHTVKVGFDHKFIPDSTKADVGDIIEFSFYPQNHSVVRSEFGFACIPYEMTGEGRVGFFSGFKVISEVLDNPPKFHVRVNDTEPIFYYCSAPGSCDEYSMVGAINPNASTPVSVQHELANNASFVLQPGEPFPPEFPAATSSILPNPAGGGHTKLHLSPGTIAGISIAAIFVAALAALLTFYIARSKTLKEEIHRKASTVARRTTPPSPTLFDIFQTTSSSSAAAVASTGMPSPPQTKPPAYDLHTPPTTSHQWNPNINAYSPPPPPLPPPPMRETTSNPNTSAITRKLKSKRSLGWSHATSPITTTSNATMNPLSLSLPLGTSTSTSTAAQQQHLALRNSQFREQFGGAGNPTRRGHHHPANTSDDEEEREESRAASPRSVGGTFDFSAETGTYGRTHGGEGIVYASDVDACGNEKNDSSSKDKDGEKTSSSSSWTLRRHRHYEHTSSSPIELDGTAVGQEHVTADEKARY